METTMFVGFTLSLNLLCTCTQPRRMQIPVAGIIPSRVPTRICIRDYCAIHPAITAQARGCSFISHNLSLFNVVFPARYKINRRISARPHERHALPAAGSRKHVQPEKHGLCGHARVFRAQRTDVALPWTPQIYVQLEMHGRAGQRHTRTFSRRPQIHAQVGACAGAHIWMCGGGARTSTRGEQCSVFEEAPDACTAGKLTPHKAKHDGTISWSRICMHRLNYMLCMGAMPVSFANGNDILRG